MCIFIISKYTKVNDDAKVEREINIYYILYTDRFLYRLFLCFASLRLEETSLQNTRKDLKKNNTTTKKICFLLLSYSRLFLKRKLVFNYILRVCFRLNLMSLLVVVYSRVYFTSYCAAKHNKIEAWNNYFNRE